MLKKTLFIAMLAIFCLKAKAQELPHLEYVPVPTGMPPPTQYPIVSPQYLPTLPPVLLPPINGTRPEINISSAFMIKSAKINGQDFSQHYINTKSSIAFYTVGDNPMRYMAIIMKGDNSFTKGFMLAVTSSETPATQTTYGKTTTLFSWQWSNSNDNKTGSATVTLIKEYRTEGTFITCHLITNDGPIIDLEAVEFR